MKAMASLLFALWRLFSPLQLPDAILWGTGLHILHSKCITSVHNFKISIKTNSRNKSSTTEQFNKMS
jgi:hypothetical protein